MFGAIVIVPSAFITRPGFGEVPGVSATSAGFTGAPLSVSLASTVGVVPPVPPFTGAIVSSTASMTLVEMSPSLPVLLVVSGSASVGVAVALLLNAPSAVIVPVTVIVALAFGAIEAIVHGIAVQAPVNTRPDRFVGVSLTATFVAVDGPAFATVIV